MCKNDSRGVILLKLLNQCRVVLYLHFSIGLEIVAFGSKHGLQFLSRNWANITELSLIDKKIKSY